ncbi:mRNA cap guanine-N7 methyltransferase, partial [Ascosphaera pollenicola]
TIQHLPLTKPDVAVAGLKQRYLGLLTAQLNLPDSNQIATPIEDSSIEEVVKILPDDFTQSSPSSDKDKEKENAENATTIITNASERNHTINISALKLSLLGWESDPDSPSLDVLTCGACFRRLGLWMYTRKPSPSSQLKEKDKEEDIETTTLNSASEHQEYCPWVNRHTQSCDASGKITNLSKISPARPGWEVLLQDIRIMHRRLLWSGPAKTSHGDVPMDAGDVEEGEEERKKRDREWWSKIQRLRQVLKVKGLKRENAAARGADSRATSVSRYSDADADTAAASPTGQQQQSLTPPKPTAAAAEETTTRPNTRSRSPSNPLAASSPTSKRKSTSSPRSEKEKEKPAIQALSHQPPPQPRGRNKRQPEHLQRKRKRGRTPPAAYSRRDRTPESERLARREDRRRAERRSYSLERSRSRSRSRSPLHSPSWTRTRTRSRSRSRSPRQSPEPVRPRKRPGGGARIGQANIEAVRRRQEERERARFEELHRRSGANVHDLVREHYNAVPERGREWRKTDSRIKGLRAFNNWVKSCVIQKFAPDEDFIAAVEDGYGAAPLHSPPPAPEAEKRLLVADLGCGKGGDLMKWQQCPQPVDLYVGLDPAEISIQQAKDRYIDMRSRRGGRGRRPHHHHQQASFHAEFYVQDCFGQWLGHIPIIQEVGIDASVGPEGNPMSARWGGGGFDVVTSMFAMHYAFESEEKARQMLHNVAGLLKKGGRFIGVGPNSDVLSANVVKFHERRKQALAAHAAAAANGEEQEEGEVDEVSPIAEWGNKIYHVRFPGETPEDGIFRPPFGWKYSYFLEEAVEEIPEYVVPWEAFRALTEEYNLELQYRKPFFDVWKEEQNDPVLGPLSERMGVRGRDAGPLLVSEQEIEAAGLYHAFCFYKV